jgi:hypothetical protein
MTMADTFSARDPLHQLRNHLGIVLGFSKLVTESFDSGDPRREDMAAIHDAARDALELLTELEKTSSR